MTATGFRPLGRSDLPAPPWNPDWELRPGDRIRLHWYGDRALPKTLGDTYATLISFSDRLSPKGDGTRRLLKWKVRCDEDIGFRLIEDSKHIV